MLLIQGQCTHGWIEFCYWYLSGECSALVYDCRPVSPVAFSWHNCWSNNNVISGRILFGWEFGQLLDL